MFIKSEAAFKESLEGNLKRTAMDRWEEHCKIVADRPRRAPTHERSHDHLEVVKEEGAQLKTN